MNKMYEYLEEHAYISKNKKSNYQSELTRERAECIANKYNSLCEEKDKEIERLTKVEKEHQRINGKLREENKELQDRFNSLMEAHKICDEENDRLNNIIKEVREYIEEHKQKGYRTPMSDDYEFWNELDENEIKELLEILDKENK